MKRLNDMRQRCTNPNIESYKDYGARGISVAQEWIDNPQAFCDYITTLGECPDGYTLDRIDNDGDYAPGNLRWASRQTQSQNRRHALTHNTELGASGYKWVYQQQNLFIGQYTHQRIKHYVGAYSTPQEAHQAVVTHRKAAGLPCAT